MNERNDPDKMRGYYMKFIVERADPAAQKRHVGCEYFVLDLHDDPFAVPALAAYETAAREAGYAALADDLRVWLDAKQRAEARSDGQKGE